MSFRSKNSRIAVLLGKTTPASSLSSKVNTTGIAEGVVSNLHLTPLTEARVQAQNKPKEINNSVVQSQKKPNENISSKPHRKPQNKHYAASKVQLGDIPPVPGVSDPSSTLSTGLGVQLHKKPSEINVCKPSMPPRNKYHGAFKTQEENRPNVTPQKSGSKMQPQSSVPEIGVSHKLLNSQAPTKSQMQLERRLPKNGLFYGPFAPTTGPSPPQSNTKQRTSRLGMNLPLSSSTGVSKPSHDIVPPVSLPFTAPTADSSSRPLPTSTTKPRFSACDVSKPQGHKASTTLTPSLASSTQTNTESTSAAEPLSFSDTKDQNQDTELSGQNGNSSDSARDWPSRIKVVRKDEKVMAIDNKMIAGPIHPRDIFKQNELRYFVNFNEYKQPIGRSGQVLVKFLSHVSKIERFCPIGEINWHFVNKTLKADIIVLVRSKCVLPPGDVYNKKALIQTAKYWRDYKHELKKRFNPEKRSIEEIYNDVPEGHPRFSWMKLVDHWHSPKGQDLSAKGKTARACQDLPHTTGSISFANVREEFKRIEKRLPSNMELFEQTHTPKNGIFPDNSLSKEFLVIERLANSSPSKSRIDIENDVFNDLMYENDNPKCLVGYGLGVDKSSVFGVQGELMKRDNNCSNADSSVASFLLQRHNQELHRRNEMLELKIDKSNQSILQSNQLMLQLLNAVSSGQVTQQFLDNTRQTITRLMNTQAPTASSGSRDCTDPASREKEGDLGRNGDV
ncbi:hypothetical protein OROMI_011357 [Orobanche minor]